MKLPLPPEQIKKILVDEGLIAPERFDALLVEANRKNQSIIDVVVAERIVEENYLNSLISKALGVPRVDFSVQTIDSEVVKALPEDIARVREVILFNRQADGSYDVAMVDPSDLETIQFLEQRLKGRIRPFLATPTDLNRGYSVYGYALGQDFKKIIEDNVRASLAAGTENEATAASQLPIVGIVDNILSYAVASRASDIHIEILEDLLFVRYRIDGILYEVMSVTKAIHPAIAARLKLLAGLKIDEHYEPQDGRFRYTIGNQVIDVRVSVIPTFYGEKVEMRLLSASTKPPSLQELGLDDKNAAIVMSNLKKSYGMILSCGPTGSGKTTTLYSLMNILNKPQVNITTIEDPIEYNMRYINQTQVNPQANMTFASGLRALLRQDPNIIMVGEIRDAETADISVQAALTGHLLMSSLHTNDAPTAIPRFFDFAVPPFLVSSVLNLVIAQRLVRKICQTCVYSYTPDAGTQATIDAQSKELGLTEDRMLKAPRLLYRGKGCPSCGDTGYLGRIGIFEILEATEPIKKIITNEHFDLGALRSEAYRGGMRTMFEDGLSKVEIALTTLEEVLRVIKE